MNKMQSYELSQTYIRFDFNADEEFKAALEKYLLYKGKKYSREIFHKELVFDRFYFSVETEEGSLKSRLKIYGKIAIGAIIAYGGVRTGVDYIVQDSRKISEQIVRDIRNERNIDPATIGRVERRLGVPGQLKRLYDAIEDLNQHHNRFTQGERQNLISRISSRYRNVVLHLDQNDLYLLEEDLQARQLPFRLPEPDPEEFAPFSVHALREEEVQLLDEGNITEPPALPPPY